MSETTDEECASRVQAGDKEAFGTLVDRYEAKLLRYGRKFLPTRQDIEDVVQEVFVSAYRNMQSFDVSQRFSPWIYRIAHNAFVDSLKGSERRPFIFPDLDTFLSYPVYDASVEQERERKDMRMMIDKGLDRMSPKYREVVILHYLEEFSYKEIADILKVPIGTVGARVKRAKEELKNIYRAMNIHHGT